MPSEDCSLLALAVDVDTDDAGCGRGKLTFRPDAPDESNEWCFICGDSGDYALQWCARGHGKQPTRLREGATFILHINDSGDKLHLTCDVNPVDQSPLPQHYIHSFLQP